MTKREFLGMGSVAAVAIVVAGGYGLTRRGPNQPEADFPIRRSEAQLQAMLSPATFHVLREGGTETPYSSPLVNEHRDGIFACAGCASSLFVSATKFDSKTGWPSFWQALSKAVVQRPDYTLGRVRTEVQCARCGGHLGHVFNDGPPPTGLRYCMNGIALTFTPAADVQNKGSKVS
jgi:peptide-methionine (R)-S-oxide reductase